MTYNCNITSNDVVIETIESPKLNYFSSAESKTLSNLRNQYEILGFNRMNDSITIRKLPIEIDDHNLKIIQQKITQREYEDLINYGSPITMKLSEMGIYIYWDRKEVTTLGDLIKISNEKIGYVTSNQVRYFISPENLLLKGRPYFDARQGKGN